MFDDLQDYQLFSGQPSDDQRLSVNRDLPSDNINTNNLENESLIFSGFLGLDSSYLEANSDVSSPPIDINNPGLIDDYESACEGQTNTDSPNGSVPSRARGLDDIMKLFIPDWENGEEEEAPFCANPTAQPPKLQPPSSPLPFHPFNVERCPVETDGIQPIALCCFARDFGKLGDRIAVARECYTCMFCSLLNKTYP